MPRLTDIRIRNTRPAAQDVLLADGGNLFLRVRPSGSRGWIVRIKRQGRRRVHTLGPWPDVSIKAARAKAARLVAIDRGTARVSVAEAVEQFMDVRVRPHHKRLDNAEVYARAIIRVLGNLAVDVVRPVDVSRMVADYRRRSPKAALLLLTFTRQLFAWCVEFGYLERSPVTDVRARAFGVVKTARERILTDNELRAFWNATDLMHASLLRFLLLTGLRIREAQQARRDDIDGEHWLTIPAAHAKNGKEHRVYLPALARAQIEPDAAPHLFRYTATATTVQEGLRRWHERHEVAPTWTPHDLRRTFASRCGDLGVPPHIIARLLNHTMPGAASLRVYLRSEWFDERKAAAESLAAHVAGILKASAK